MSDSAVAAILRERSRMQQSGAEVDQNFDQFGLHPPLILGINMRPQLRLGDDFQRPSSPSHIYLTSASPTDTASPGPSSHLEEYLRISEQNIGPRSFACRTQNQQSPAMIPPYALIGEYNVEPSSPSNDGDDPTEFEQACREAISEAIRYRRASNGDQPFSPSTSSAGRVYRVPRLRRKKDGRERQMTAESSDDRPEPTQVLRGKSIIRKRKQPRGKGGEITVSGETERSGANVSSMDWKEESELEEKPYRGAFSARPPQQEDPQPSGQHYSWGIPAWPVHNQ